MDPDLREMRSIPEGRLADWVDRRFPDGGSPQWWLAIFESLEASAHPLRNLTPERRAEDLIFAAEFMKLAQSRGNIGSAVCAHWALRIASLVARCVPPVPSVPEIFSPDGSARWGLRSITLTREQALRQAKSRRSEYLHADESFYASPVRTENSAGVTDYSALRDVELIISALQWVSSSVKDEETAAEIRLWLEIKYEL
ncbi:hypothetical protein AB0H83_51580 [Dactylosporangium sp. NPDC050688]|uniref:hypothetical protein n=1 Tax=Dactylosporangium sp. NPDC050688 TaxID=3157217 RepID=UPI0033F313CA